MTRTSQLLCIFILVVAVLVASILGLVLRRGMQSDSAGVLDRIVRLERGNAQQVLEHRDANQGDHNEAKRYHQCMLRLIVSVSDPQRDQSVPPRLPEGCESTVAVDEATK